MDTERIVLEISVDEYVQAFNEIRDFLEPKNKWRKNRRLELLQAHYYARKQDVTATQLADAVGYINYNGANLQYGLIAGKLTNAIYAIVGSVDEERLKRLKAKLPANYVNIDVLVHFIYPKDSTDGQFHWIMRTEVAKALEKSGLLEKK